MFKHFTLSGPTVALAFIALAVAGHSSPAKAFWTFDHWEKSAGKMYDHNWYSSGGVQESFSNGSFYETNEGRGGQIAGSSNSSFTQSKHPNNTPYPGQVNCKASLAATVHAVYRWEPEEIGWDPETDEPIYSAPSTQPLWILEKAEMTVKGNGGTVTMAPEGFGLDMKSATNLPEQPDEDGRDPEPYITTSVQGDNSNNGEIIKKVTGLKFKRIDPVGDKAYGPPHTFQYSAAVSRAGFQSQVEWAGITVGFTYDVCLVNFGLMVRPCFLGNAGYGALQEPYNSGNGSMGGGRSVTAGGYDNPQHKAEVWLTMSPAVLGILPAKNYPRVKLAYRVGKDQEAEFRTFQDPRPTPCVTDWSNYYQAYMGEFVSRNVTTGKPPVYPTVMLGYGGGNPQAVFDMTWANVEWRMGENGEKDWETLPPVGPGAKYQSPIWARILSSASNEPLVGHQYQFRIGKLIVEEDVEGEDEFVTKIFTADQIEAQNLRQEYSGDSRYQIFSGDNIDGLVARYISIGNQVQAAQDILKATLTVQGSDDFEVKQFVLRACDMNVFRKNGLLP